MRRYLAIIAGLLLCAGMYCLAQAQIPTTGAGNGVPGTVAAACSTGGPGDCVSGWKMWWGLRCFSNAYSGNVVDIVDASTGNTLGTRLQCSSLVVSALVSASACTFVTGNACSPIATTCAVACVAVTLYDQSGAAACSGACNLTQATNSQRPAFDTNIIGTHPSLFISGPQTNTLTNTTGCTAGVSQPLTTMSVMEQTAGGVFAQILDLNSGAQSGFSSNNLAAMFAGGLVSATAADNVFHAIQYIFDNAGTTAFYIDGTNTAPGTAGTGACTAGTIALGSNGGGQFFDGYIEEAGVIAQNTNTTSHSVGLNNNAHTQLGF